MINALELTLRDSLQAFWLDAVSKIGTKDDIIPDIFANLPPDGDYSANWKAIGENFKRMATGNPKDDVTWSLQFPATPAQIPGVTIEVGTEQEQEVIASFIDEYDNPELNTIDRLEGGPFTKTYAVGIFSYNPDTTIYLYSFVKYGLLVLRNNLDDTSSFDLSARPMSVLTQYGAEPVYVRYIDVVATGVVDSVVRHYDKVTRTAVDVQPTNPNFSGVATIPNEYKGG